VKDHSVFARAFLDVLEADNMPIEGYRVFRAFDGKVLRFAQQQKFDQAPLYAAMQQAGHEGGDFIFVPNHSGFQRELGTLKVRRNRIRKRRYRRIFSRSIRYLWANRCSATSHRTS
jgi:hypothetical protein